MYTELEQSILKFLTANQKIIAYGYRYSDGETYKAAFITNFGNHICCEYNPFREEKGKLLLSLNNTKELDAFTQEQISKHTFKSKNWIDLKKELLVLLEEL